jgi:valyl-tRNA synthetase
MLQQWEYQDISFDDKDVLNAQNFIDFIEEYRSIEKLFEIKKEDKVLLFSNNENLQKLFLDNQDTLEFLTRKQLSHSPLSNGVTLPFKSFDFILETNQIDIKKIKQKLSDSKAALEKEKSGIDRNLSNENFTARAPKELIDQNTSRQKAINLELSKIDSILNNI